MNANNETSTADREIITTRVFDVPRDLVWIQWTFFCSDG